MVVTKQDLHKLVDELPEDMHTDAAEGLKRLRDLANDPVYQAFVNAPEDDEPLTPEDIAAIEEAQAEIARGEVYTVEGVWAELAKRRECE